VIVVCYGSQQLLSLEGHVPNPQVRAITQIVANTLGPVVQHCVLNQKLGPHGLTMCVKTKMKI
jgi:hypothetical protein